MNEPSVFSGPEITMHGDAVHGEYEHREIHNVYGQYMQKSTTLGLYRRSGGMQRTFLLSRAFYAGSQKFGAIWTGDNASQWSHLKASVPMCLSITLSGLSFCGADVGGFFGNPDATLLSRWHQVAAFQPFMRAHAHIESRRREPWLFGEPYLSQIREALHTRYSLLPYIYTAFYFHHIAGTPIMRPLFMEFPTFPEFETENYRYMLGPALYIVPVFENRQQKATVTFPTAPWYDFYTWKRYDAGIHEIDVSPDKIPVFVKGGSIIFKQERLRRSSDLMKNDPYSIYIAVDSDGNASGQVYIDDGNTFSYTSGDYLLATLQFSKDRATFSTEGSFKSTNTVDKIAITSLPKAVKHISISADGETWQASFYKAPDTVTVKLPRLKMTGSWTLSLEYEADE